MRSSSPDVLPPTAARRYLDLALVGEGGMGTVYRAWDEQLGREVALKVLRTDLGGHHEVARRFRREAAILARLRHPNVVRFLDFEIEEGVAYLTMEFVDGRSLDALIRGDGLTVPETVNLIRQAAEGLSAVHAEAVLHRDLKPGNILVTSDGVPRITDFGLAKLDEASNVTALTKTDVVMGTQGYFPPEVLLGQPSTEVGDVYQLGVVLYEALTGRLPFTHEELVKRLVGGGGEGPALPSTLLDGADPELDSIVERTLAVDPHLRYSTAAALGRACALWLGARGLPGGVEASSEGSPWDRVTAPSGRSRAASGASGRWALLAVTLLLTGLFLGVLRSRAPVGLQGTPVAQTRRSGMGSVAACALAGGIWFGPERRPGTDLELVVEALDGERSVRRILPLGADSLVVTGLDVLGRGCRWTLGPRGGPFVSGTLSGTPTVAPPPELPGAVNSDGARWHAQPMTDPVWTADSQVAVAFDAGMLCSYAVPLRRDDGPDLDADGRSLRLAWAFAPPGQAAITSERRLGGLTALQGGHLLLATARRDGRLGLWCLDPVLRREGWAARCGQGLAMALPSFTTDPADPWNAPLGPSEWQAVLEVPFEATPAEAGLSLGKQVILLAGTTSPVVAAIDPVSRSLLWRRNLDGLPRPEGEPEPAESIVRLPVGGRPRRRQGWWWASAPALRGGRLALAAAWRRPAGEPHLMAVTSLSLDGVEGGTLTTWPSFAPRLDLATGGDVVWDAPPKADWVVVDDGYQASPVLRRSDGFLTVLFRSPRRGGVLIPGAMSVFEAVVATRRGTGGVVLHEPAVCYDGADFQTRPAALTLTDWGGYLMGATGGSVFAVDISSGQAGTWRRFDDGVNGLRMGPRGLAAVVTRSGSVFVLPPALLAATGKLRLRPSLD